MILRNGKSYDVTGYDVGIETDELDVTGLLYSYETKYMLCYDERSNYYVLNLNDDSMPEYYFLVKKYGCINAKNEAKSKYYELISK